ncbi:MAG: type II secretion system protein [Planctomycetota bacterium]|jgi:prepilin-type N-terminal cleavage/methylation domain-containing protein
MRRQKHIFGLTLVEMIVVIAVIALLVSLAITALRRIENSAKEELAAGTIASLAAACEQFSDYEYRYPNPAYADLDFPLDCSGLDAGEIEAVMTDALGVLVLFTGDPNDSGCAMLYYFLSRVPECRVTLGEIDASLVTDKDKNGTQMQIDVAGRVEPLLRVVDPWRTTLRYDYYDEDWFFTDFDEMKKSRRTFPVITSAGRDRDFGTADDITSK